MVNADIQQARNQKLSGVRGVCGVRVKREILEGDFSASLEMSRRGRIYKNQVRYEKFVACSKGCRRSISREQR